MRKEFPVETALRSPGSKIRRGTSYRCLKQRKNASCAMGAILCVTTLKLAVRISVSAWGDREGLSSTSVNRVSATPILARKGGDQCKLSLVFSPHKPTPVAQSRLCNRQAFQPTRSLCLHPEAWNKKSTTCPWM